jgi:hypothetical protein
MNAEDQFWRWFVEHETELFEFDPSCVDERERLFDQLSSELQKVQRDLTFEFGPPGASREFVISACGIQSAFPAVVAVANAAPNSLSRWTITTFRPRRPISAIEFQDKRIDPNRVEFTLLDDGEKAGLYLFIPGFTKDDMALKQIGYLLLDQAVGEYDVETRLGLIEMFSPSDSTKGERFPLSELPEMFDQLVARLEGNRKVQ